MSADARQLNAAAGVLYALAAALLLLSGWRVLVDNTEPLREITVFGPLENTSREAIEDAVRGKVSGSLLALDLDDVRQRFERLPWVRRVDVRRVWPDRIEVRVEEHVALARWGERALINTYGERFAGRSDAHLPRLAGPPGSEAQVASRYRAFSRLLAPLGTPLAELTLTPRQAWHARLETGLYLVLGRDTPAESADARLARFVSAYAQTLGRIDRRHEYVDLRYPNGFALRTPKPERAPGTAKDVEG